MADFAVVCWKWRPAQGYRSTFGAEQVNTLRAMVARHCRMPHDFVCVTDDAVGIAPGIRVVPLWSDHAELPSPLGRRGPSCYRRLRAFAADAADWLAPRFVSLDLDTVITGDVTPLWDRAEDFVMWGDTHPTTPYNGSMFLLRAGARRQVWEQFDPVASPAAARALGYIGSDQAWIGACLGPQEATWGVADGVYSFRVHLREGRKPLPKDARIVFFHGQHDPWDAGIRRRLPWVARHWRADAKGLAA